MKMGIERALKARPWHAPASRHLATRKETSGALYALLDSRVRWHDVIGIWLQS